MADTPAQPGNHLKKRAHQRPLQVEMELLLQARFQEWIPVPGSTRSCRSCPRAVGGDATLRGNMTKGKKRGFLNHFYLLSL